MGRNARRMRREQARRRRQWADGGRMPDPVVMPGRVPGTIDVALPMPPGLTDDEARALALAFAAEMGLTVADLYVCTPDTCPHVSHDDGPDA